MAAAVLADPADAANREVLHADALTAEALLGAGVALPLFGERRLVLVRGLAGAPARAVDRLRAALEAARERPGGWPGAGITVLLLAGGVDRRSPVLRLVPPAEQVELRPPTGRAVTGWLQARARAAGLALAPAAADALVALVGEDLGRLAGELEKAALLAGPDARIDETVVRALVGESRVRRHWELTQALEEGNAAAAVRVLEELTEAGEEPTVILGLVLGHVRDLWRAKAAAAAGTPARELAPLFRNRPAFAIERLLARARATSGTRLEEAVRACFDVECRLKSGGGEPRALLAALVLERVGA